MMKQMKNWGGQLVSNMGKIWRLWAKSLGEKVGENDRQADTIAAIRTFWWLAHIVACFMIIIHNGNKLGWW